MSDQASGARAVTKTPSTLHDIITGGVEGGVGVLALEPLLEKLKGKLPENPFHGGVGPTLKRLGTGAAIGAGATGLIGALVSLTANKSKQRRAARERQEMGYDPMIPIIELEAVLDDFPRAKKKNRPLVQAAGVAALAGGLSVFPAARRLVGIKARQIGAQNLGIKEAARNQGGKMVADYIEAAQLGLNKGLKGRVVGKTIEHVMAHPEGKVAGAFKAVPGAYGSHDLGQRLASEHFARFRSSPLSALHFWDYEHGLLRESKLAKQTAGAKARGVPLSERITQAHQRATDEMHYGREKTHAAIKEQVEKHGKSEMDAIKHVAYNHEDPQIQNYFNRLAETKTKAVDMYAKKSLVSPALVAAGTGGIVYGRKKNQSPRQALGSTVRVPVTGFDRFADDLPDVIHNLSYAESMIELDRYDPTSDRQLRAGVRLDKYAKSIRAGEIDRHIHDYVRSAAIGAVAGAAIPARRSLKVRSAVGAGVGTLVAGVLHSTGHQDAYGEQSEEAKILQRNTPKYLGAAAVVGGLLARSRLRKTALRAV
jgi:hypothetical protein